jgi:ADP-ribosyl-[dinitrogen reductase] hydrolase
MKDTAKDILLGIAVGDALGVPYEFSRRDAMERNPAKDMVGFKVHNQPPGTWSDDSSLSFCLAESLLGTYDLKTCSEYFVKWRNEAFWTAYGEVFDIGATTNRAISLLETILKSKNHDTLKFLKDYADEHDNGNGSLMRILPLIFEIKGKALKAQFDMVWESSALTHGHIRAAMGCMIYLKLAENLLNGLEKKKAYQQTRNEIMQLWEQIDFPAQERKHFERIVQSNIQDAKKESILSGGYVIEALEASLWSFLRSDSYQSAVLTAINFGHDTDTTGAITGGLAGIYYGSKNIPKYWIASLARLDDILELAKELSEKYSEPS